MNYGEALEQVQNNVPYYINLQTKNARVGNKTLVDNGNILLDVDSDFSWNGADELYEQYKYSVPHSNQKESYFKALPSEELTESELAFNEDRTVAQFQLEMYILLGGLKGELEIPEFNWFRKGRDIDFICLAQWVR